MFGNLNNDGLEKSEDRLGGGRQAFDADIYAAKIKLMYGIKSSGGAMGVELLLDLDGKEYKETIYVTSGDTKGNKNYFEKDGKKYPMPGFTVVNDLVMAATGGKELKDLEFEDRTVKVYNFEKRTEENKVVQHAPELIDAEVLVAITNTAKNKQKKNDSTGEYEDVIPAVIIHENSIAKVFDATSKRTVREALDGKDEAQFHDEWLKKNQGVVYDKVTTKPGEGAAAGGPPKAAAGTQAPAKSGSTLFGKK